jgi:putative nucleotidyltransferase with HDIG domain
MKPGLAALLTKRSMTLRISPTPSSRTDGNDRVYPFRGIFKVSYGLRRLPFSLRSIEGRSICYAAILVAGAVLTSIALLVEGHSVDNWWAVAALGSTALLAERGQISLGPSLKASISLFPALVAIVLFGPLAGMIVAAACTLADPPRPYARWLVHASSRALAAAAAGLIAVQIQDHATSTLAGIVLSSAAAALSAQSLDVAFAIMVSRIRGYRNGMALVGTLTPLILASVPLYAPVVALLVVGYEAVSPWTLPLFLVPALAAQRSFLLYQDQRRLAVDLAEVNDQLERANLSFATALVATLDARDQYTAGHSAAVSIYAKDIAERLGLEDTKCRLAHLAGLVHDIGKIGLPPGLLEKPGALTLEERRLMEQHSEIGERILAKVDDYAEIAQIVRHHHERVDGNGYPDGLHSDQIPLISKIIAVADAYNAMTSDRPYRDAMPSSVARMRLAQAVESQFDTTVVAAFEAILAGATEEYRSGTRFDFVLTTQQRSAEALPVAHVA